MILNGGAIITTKKGVTMVLPNGGYIPANVEIEDISEDQLESLIKEK